MALPPSNRANQLGSGFTTLQRYLGANKANQLGSTVGSGIQKAGQQATGAMQTAGNKFQQGFQQEQNRLGSEGQRVDRVMGDVTKASDEDVNAFEGIRGGKTKGPQEIENANELREKARQAKSLGEATGSEAGRYGLLQRYVGAGKQYTGGQQRLDNLLLGQTGAGNLRQARRDTSGLVNAQQNQENTALAQGKQLASQAKGLADTTISRLGTGVTDYDTAMQAAAAKAAADRAAYVAQAKTDLSKEGTVDEELFNKFGITEGQKIWDADLGQFVNENDLAATKQNVQAQTDFDKIQALRRLSGNSLTGDPSARLAEFNDAKQVGAFKAAGNFADINKDTAGQFAKNWADQRKEELAQRQREVIVGRNYMNQGNAIGDPGWLQGDTPSAQNALIDQLDSGNDVENWKNFADPTTRIQRLNDLAAKDQAMYNNSLTAFNQGQNSGSGGSQANLNALNDYFKQNYPDFKTKTKQEFLSSGGSGEEYRTPEQQMMDYLQKRPDIGAMNVRNTQAWAPKVQSLLDNVNNQKQATQFYRTFKKKV